MIRMEFIGNLTRDPQLRTLTDGQKVCDFAVAVNRRKPNGEQTVQYVTVSVWGSNAENCARYLAKGRKVYVEGTPSARAYEDRGGHARCELTVRASSVEFLTAKRDAAAADEPAVEEYTEVDDDELPF